MEKRPINEKFADLVRSRLDELGENPFAAEKRAGLPADSIRNLLRKGRPSSPNLVRAQEICDALHLELYVGPKRYRDRPRLDEVAAAVTLANEDFAAINLHNIDASAGPGATPLDEEPVGALAFRRTWLQREGVNPARAGVVRVKGDSMTPTLQDGDIILVRYDAPGVSDGMFRDGSINVFRAEGEVHVKRLYRIGKRVIATSDNPAHEPLVFQAGGPSMTLIGDVIWTGHAIAPPQAMRDNGFGWGGK